MRLPLLLLLLSITTLAQAGFVEGINRKNMEIYFNLGLEREQGKDYEGAKEAYSRALINARSGEASATTISALLFNLGRMTGYTCDFSSAAQILKESLDAERALPQPGKANITKRLSELARLTFDMGLFRDSVDYYEQAIPMLEQFGVDSSDPVGFANYLTDFSKSLDSSGNISRSAQVRVRAETLIAANIGKPAQFTPIYYHDVCAK